MFEVLNLPHTLLLIAVFALFVLLDYLAPERRYAQSRWWRLRGIVSALVYFALATYSPYLWSEALSAHLLFDATEWSLLVAVPVGYALMQLVHYLWHRALHRFDVLWRLFHQMHHSAERLDIYGALYFHPLDVIGFTFANSFALTVILGLSPAAAALCGALAGLLALFSHANLRTPRWLGFFIARPEVHAVHHQRGRHGSNYGELMLWDQVFGSFCNPHRSELEVGFYDGASERVVEALLGRDISEPPKVNPDAQRPAVLKKFAH
jgi:sterol desaturase/sphingolipid hydroxylase (fatty acid hydroxylase superfamily)